MHACGQTQLNKSNGLRPPAASLGRLFRPQTPGNIDDAKLDSARAQLFKEADEVTNPATPATRTPDALAEIKDSLQDLRKEVRENAQALRDLRKSLAELSDTRAQSRKKAKPVK
jgi:septal ring factor EnvC (AmiA/AmiB activator)